MSLKLSEIVRFDHKASRFVLGTKQGQEFAMDASLQTEMDQLLAALSRGSASPERSAQEDHRMLAAAMLPPIEQAIPYVRWTDVFFQPASFAPLEDNALPVEDIVTMAWQTHDDGRILFTRPGLAWTRPDFSSYDTGLEIPWSIMAKAGWNVFERQMRRATGDIARKVDTAAQAILDAAVVAASQTGTVSGGKLTKAAFDAVIKAQNAKGFPVTIAAINSGTATDMAGWTGGVFSSGLPDATAQELISKLWLGTYGNVRLVASPFVPAAYVYFGGPAGNTGYEQVRGSMQVNSDVDIKEKVDLHAITSAEYAWYIGNGLQLYRLQITA
jgi:hypothetical protein